jgi:hypothetical protein
VGGKRKLSGEILVGGIHSCMQVFTASGMVVDTGASAVNWTKRTLPQGACLGGGGYQRSNLATVVPIDVYYGNNKTNFTECLLHYLT